MMKFLAEQSPYFSLVALGVSMVAVIVGIWAITRRGNLIHEQAATLQRLRGDILDLQTESANLTKTARSISESLGRMTGELHAVRNRVSQLADAGADTSAVLHALGKEVNNALQSKEVSELLKSDTRLGLTE